MTCQRWECNKVTMASFKEFLTGIWAFVGEHLFGVILFCGLAAAVIYGEKARKDLRTKGVLVEAKILDVTTPNRGSSDTNLKCAFKLGDRDVETWGSSFLVYTPDASRCIGRIYPAMYSYEHDLLRVLVTKRDYAYFGMSVPDSVSRDIPE